MTFTGAAYRCRAHVLFNIFTAFHPSFLAIPLIFFTKRRQYPAVYREF